MNHDTGPTPTLAHRLYWTLRATASFRGQARYAFRPLAEIRKDQETRIRRMVKYAYRYVPFYREAIDQLGASPASFQSADDLAKLPLISRESLQQASERFLSVEQPLENYLALRSSGSSGRPCTFYHDWRGLFQEIGHGARAREALKGALGRDAGFRKTWIFPPADSAWALQCFYTLHMLDLSRWRGARQQLSVLDTPEKNVQLLDSFGPDVIFGYGSYLAMLLAHIHQGGGFTLVPKALQYTSDALPVTARHLITEDLHIPVFSLYEASEAHNLAFECEEHTGLHANIDLYPTRCVDEKGRKVPRGEPGEVVISNLINRGTVLLNYRLGDVSAMLPHACACGRSLPSLSHVHGRSLDWLELPSGQLVHPQVLLGVFKSDERIWQYQVVQDSPAVFLVNIVPAPGLDRGRTNQGLTSALKQVLGAGIEVHVQYVNAIERTAGGKVRTIVSLATRERLARLGLASDAV